MGFSLLRTKKNPRLKGFRTRAVCLTRKKRSVRHERRISTNEPTGVYLLVDSGEDGSSVEERRSKIERACAPWPPKSAESGVTGGEQCIGIVDLEGYRAGRVYPAGIMVSGRQTLLRGRAVKAFGSIARTRSYRRWKKHSIRAAVNKAARKRLAIEHGREEVLAIDEENGTCRAVCRNAKNQRSVSNRCAHSVDGK